MIIRALKRLHQIYKQECEISRAERRLATVPIDYIALQTIADTVSSGYNVTISVTQPDGTHIVVERSKQNDIGFESFKDKYNKAHQGDFKR